MNTALPSFFDICLHFYFYDMVTTTNRLIILGVRNNKVFCTTGAG